MSSNHSKKRCILESIHFLNKIGARSFWRYTFSIKIIMTFHNGMLYVTVLQQTSLYLWEFSCVHLQKTIPAGLLDFWHWFIEKWADRVIGHSVEYADTVCHLRIQFCPNCRQPRWEAVSFISQGRLGERDSIYMIIEKPSSLLNKNFPVCPFLRGRNLYSCK